MQNIFLESHNIKNPYSGFGQFNYHLIKAFYKTNTNDFKFTLHAKNTSSLHNEFGDFFDYKTYKSISRHSLFRIRKKYDVWHSLNQNIKIEPFFNIPYILTIHDVHFVEEKQNKNYKKSFNHLNEKIKRSNAITYISEFAKTATHKYFDVPKVPERVIYNGNPIQDILIDDNYLPKIKTSRPFLFFIGEISARKNVHTLVEMLHYLPDYDLILAGNNTSSYCQKKLTEIIKKTNTASRVIFTGKINEKEKQYYFKNCSAFVFPSLKEGFGIPPIEAMRFGKPVFLANLTSLPEIGGKYAFYWDHFDSEYMANVFEKGIDAYETNRKSFETNYIKRAQSFNWDKAALEYINIYKSLL